MSESTHSSTRHVLVVESDPELAGALEEHLGSLGSYAVTMAGTGAEALVCVQGGGVDVMVVASTLPDGPAVHFVPAVLAETADLPVIVLADIADVASAGQCVQRGAFTYLVRPVDKSEFTATLEQGIRWREEKAVTKPSDSGSTHVADPLAQMRQQYEQAITGTLEMVMSMSEAKDPTLVGHSQRVSALAATVADEMGLSDEEVEDVRIAGRLHDLGKIGVPDAILQKRDAPTEEDKVIARRHAAFGAEILEGIEHLSAVADSVRCHHEHWDGSGYPEGLSGEEIPLGARILCAVEVYDALTTAGANREALAGVDAVRRMMALEGSVLDPRVLVALAEVVASQRNLPFLTEPEQRLNASGIAMIL